MDFIKLTAAQAFTRFLAAQSNEHGEKLFEGVWAIFGHGNVAGLGQALHEVKDILPTFRGHNEQSMAHAAIAFAKQNRRKKMMAVTSSIGPGATNMVTAAALAHVNRLPVLFIPGDVFGNRAPDPVLQQIEDFSDGTVSANDCFKPVSRYFDKIGRPEHLLTALPRAMATLTDATNCGPVTLSFCQDVQSESFEFPTEFFNERIWHTRRLQPDEIEFAAAAQKIREASSPVIVAGGGVHYSEATEQLRLFVEKYHVPVTETQAGKSVLAWDHPLNYGPVGVTGSTSANQLFESADLVIGIGTRFQDFTTGSWSLFGDLPIVTINASPYDAHKRNATPLVSDAKVALERLSVELGNTTFLDPNEQLKIDWFKSVDPLTDPPVSDQALPTDMQVIGAVQRKSSVDTVVMCAAGTMPGELHKLWKATVPGSYHMEYGFSCMGYEIAGALGIKMADPSRHVICMVGDGSYMMMNSELATAVMMGIDFTVVITDNRGFGCINRLQIATGGAEFNNLLDDSMHQNPSNIDFAKHAESMGANALKVSNIRELEIALGEAQDRSGVSVIVINTDPYLSTPFGGAWWDVVVPEVSTRQEVVEKRRSYEANRRKKR